MKFNIFADIFHGPQNKLASTFGGKFKDTLLVMAGTNKRFGLFDYITLFTPSFFSSLKTLSSRTIELIVTMPIIGILLCPLSIPMYLISKCIFTILQLTRYLTSFIASLLLLPVITLIHLIWVLVNKDLSNPFGKKVEDMFDFIHGDETGLGLFDHLTLCIKIPIDYFLDLSIEAICIIKSMPVLGVLILPVSIPMLVTSVLLTAIYYSVRFVVSLVLTGLTLPFVLFTHAIAIWNKQRIDKNYITDIIENTAQTNNSIVAIPSDFSLDDSSTDHLIEELNKHSAIRELHLPTGNTYREPDGLLDQLIPRLKHVTSITTGYKCTDNTLALIPQSPIEYFKFNARGISEEGLFEFLKHNKKVVKLTIGEKNPFNENSSTNFKTLMQLEGIQQPCTFDSKSGKVKEINATMNDIATTHHMIKNCFEFFKCTRSEENAIYLPLDIRSYITGVLLLVCPRDIFEQNQKGFIRAIQSEGFFSTPNTKPLHVEVREVDERVTFVSEARC